MDWIEDQCKQTKLDIISFMTSEVQVEIVMDCFPSYLEMLSFLQIGTKMNRV